MTDDMRSTQRDRPPAWTRGPHNLPGAPGEPEWRPPVSRVNRFLGGSPVAVFCRLLVVSLIVGALLMWLDIRPIDVFRGLTRFADRLWALGFDAVREFADYIIAGAIIVVPVWFVLRLLNMRQMR